MTFLPILSRELRVASRRRSTYWLRAGAALWIILLGTWFFLLIQHQAPREIAMGLFGLLTGSAVLYCLLSGVRSTADCISEEKREGTLGLLFLTDLKGYDVVAGKLAATSINAFYAVLAVVPMLAIPLLMGGITLGEFGRMSMVAVNTMFFSLSVGICISSMSQSGRKAMASTFLVILVLTAFLPALGAWLSYLGKLRSIGSFFLFPSAGFLYASAFDSQFRPAPAQFWWSLGVIHALGWLCLFLASWITPRAWQDRPAGTQTLRWRERWHLWSYGDVSERAGFRRQLLDVNAFFWLSARARLRPAYVWGVLALLGAAWAWGLVKFRHDWLNEGMYVVAGVLLNILMKGWFGSEVGRQLAEDRQTGALELLLSTPLSVRDILRGQQLALQRQFLGPVLFVLMVYLAFMLATVSQAIMGAERGFWILLYAAAMVMLVADLVALYWVGMWQALTAKNPNRAATSSLVRILVLPWGGMALTALVVGLAAVAGDFNPGSNFFLYAWLVLGLVTDIGFGLWARTRLLTQFRQAAAMKYASLPGFWKRVFSGGPTAPAQAPPVVEVSG